jgi:fructose-1,6-bisphosphatase I
MLKRLLHSGVVCMVVSEENEMQQYAPEEMMSSAKYAVAMDPLDGSSNIACNIPVGTIFGIWKRESAQKTHPSPDLFVGRKLVAAGYVLYGPSCMLVFCTGQGVHGFTYDPSVGEFILTHENMKFPAKPKCYSVNEAYFSKWDKNIQDYVTFLKTPDKAAGRSMTGRYVGSLVADFHRNLLYGGVFAYPKDKDTPAGKLRLLYEAAPLSFIAEHAGGMGSSGEKNILDIVPESLHQRIPLYIGNVDEVRAAEDFIAGKRKL